MTALEANYGIGVKNRFMLLSEEEESSSDELDCQTNDAAKHDIINDMSKISINKLKQGGKATDQKGPIKNENHLHPVEKIEEKAPLRPNKREFDRHSGSDKTGIKPIEKREGAGSYNWGNPIDDIKESNIKSVVITEEDQWDKPEERAPKTQLGFEGLTATQKANDTADYVNKSNDAVDEEDLNLNSGVTEEEPVQMTLDEWRALQNADFTKPDYNIRQPGEGEDKSKWKGTYVYKQSDDHLSKNEDKHPHNKTSGKETATTSGTSHKKILVDINVKYTSPYTARGRGGVFRGAPRGGGGRGAFRGGASGENNPTTHNNNSSSPHFNHDSRSHQDDFSPSPSGGGGNMTDNSPYGATGDGGFNRGGGRGGGRGRGFRPSGYPGRGGGFSRGAGRPPPSSSYRGSGRGGGSGNFNSNQQPQFNADTDFPSLRTISAK